MQVTIVTWRCKITSAFKRLTASKITVFVFIIYVCAVYMYYVYRNTHKCIYLRKICEFYILNLFIL